MKNKTNKNNRTRTRTRIRTNTRTKHIKKGRTFHGGKLIGQGNFGCVFRPDLTNKSKDETTSDIVSKVVLKNNAFSEYRHEYKILKKMREIDPKGQFHSLMVDAFDLKSDHVPPDFSNCSLTTPSYSRDEFFVFNIIFSGNYNLTHYLTKVFSINKDKKIIPGPSILFSLLTNIIVGIKKMNEVNILHKTLDTDSIYLKDPISLTNPYCAKIIDYGEGELRKYKGYSDKNQDYIVLFKSVTSILDKILKQHHNTVYTKVIHELINGFTELLSMVENDKVSYNDVIKRYILLIQTTFGKKYSDYAKSKYKF
jgi:hypothetical protein